MNHLFLSGINESLELGRLVVVPGCVLGLAERGLVGLVPDG